MDQTDFFHAGSECSMQRLSLANGELLYWPSWLTVARAHGLFEQLLNELPWQQDSLRIAGKVLPVPRLQCWFGPDYSYSGLRLKPSPWHKQLIALRDEVAKACDAEFNSVLANLYRDENDSVAWHADDEVELGAQPIIASLSFGATRRFRLRHKFDKRLSPVTLDLAGASLLCMRGDLQAHWLHQVPKEKQTRKARINLTFRYIYR